MTNEELNAIRKGYLDAVTADHLMIPWSIRWVVQQVPGLVSEVERLTQELDQAQAVALVLSHRAVVQRRDTPKGVIYWVCLHCLSKAPGLPLLQHTPDCPVSKVRAWDEKPREETPK